MIAGSYFYRPNHIVVKINVPVEITIRREGIIPHTFVLQSVEAGINLEEKLNTEPKTLRFTPRTEGEFTFYCNGGMIESHREKGMEGVLQVTQSGGSQF
jgi:plastocyanin domain-containing protein